MPDWTKSVFPGGKFDQLRKLSFTHDTYSDELKKLKAGPFISEVITHYKDFISPVKNTEILKKMYLYSAHDISLTRVMTSLGVYNNQPPPYTSILIFNLLDQNGLKVGITFRNNTSSIPYSLTLPGCDLFCPLDQFMEITRQLWTLNREQDCKIV